MKPNPLLLLALLPLGACGDVRHAATDYTPSSSRLATAGNDEVPRRAPVVARALAPAAPVAPVSVAEPTRAEVALAPDPPSTLRGGGRVEPAGSSTLVRVDLAGGSPYTTYQGTVRRGSCSAIGSTVASLVPVTVDSIGTGRSASQVAVPIRRLLSAPHVLVFGAGGRVEACGAVAVAITPTSAGATP
jgi:hypothetical protein